MMSDFSGITKVSEYFQTFGTLFLKTVYQLIQQHRAVAESTENLASDAFIFEA